MWNAAAVKRRRVGLATTSGSGETIPAGWEETAALGDSSMGSAAARRQLLDSRVSSQHA